MEQKNNKLKILGLKVDGFRKLSAFEMELRDKGLSVICGKNKQGKTTVIDSIQWLIAGNKVLNPDAIQHGKEKIEGELRLGDYFIKRVASKKSQRLEVRNTKTNTVVKGEVQNFLDTFINELTFNPRPFLDKTPHQQLKFAMDLFKIDFSELDKQLETLEQDRLLCGREIKKFGDLEEEKPEKVERINITELLAKKQEIEKKNDELRKKYEQARLKELEKIEVFNSEQRSRKLAKEEAERKLRDLHTQEREAKDEIERLEHLLKEAKAKAKRLDSEVTEALEAIKQLPEPEPEKPLSTLVVSPKYEDTTEIDHRITQAGAVNERAEAYERWVAKKKEKDEKQKEYDAYNEQIKTVREKKLAMLRAVNTGVEGLEIREDGLYYNDVYSENWSDSEAIRISSELCLAQLPKLRAIFIDRFESFDKESREAIAKWAEEKDIQAIVTVVEDDMPEGKFDEFFWIEEGKISRFDNREGE